MAFFFTSCSKNDGGMGVGVGIGIGPVWIQIGNGGGNYYPQNYYPTGVPNGVTTFVGYVRGGSGDPTKIPVFYQNGAPMGIFCSSTSLGGNMVYFFNWLSSQSPNTLVPVVLSVTYYGGVPNYTITWAAW